MAISNIERVRQIETELRRGLGPFVLRRYKFAFKGEYLKEMELKLYDWNQVKRLPDEATALAELDLQSWFKLVEGNWNAAFRQQLGTAERSYLNELRAARNRKAHETDVNQFTNDDAYRVADTAGRLLRAINAVNEADVAEKHAYELARERFSRDEKREVKRIDRDLSIDTPAGLQPWRMVIEPHPDIQHNLFTQAEFAADLERVRNKDAQPEYENPIEFFSRTCMTDGLLQLVANGLQRLTGNGGNPVVQLQTNFGGGKTHSLIAMYHAFGGDYQLSNLRNDDFARIRSLAGSGVPSSVTAKRAVLVGTYFDVSVPRNRGAYKTRTVWGEIAHQLGGAEAYKLVAASDANGVSPGIETLIRLLKEHGPALIILDEFVRLAQNVYQATPAPPAGGFDSNLAFAQALSEAVKAVPDSLLLVSLPSSEIETGGEGGHVALERLQHTLGRVEFVWKPVTATESYEIVRRRLFNDVSNSASRDATVNKFYEMYRKNHAEYPSGTTEPDYRLRMMDTYPIHPELFERLYEDWSMLDRFQRTRGVLRIMAQVIRCLWVNGDASPLIMPSTLPLWDRGVQNELTRYLPDGFSTVVDRDVDGQDSNPAKIDRPNPNLQRIHAARKVARAIFMGSAPSVREQANRGISERQIKLATAQPGNPPGVFSDALRQMTNSLSHLYHDGTRYWYDTRPNLNRTASDIAAGYEVWQLRDEAIRRLKQENTRQSGFARVHVAPASSGEVPDEQSARLVALRPEQTYARRNDQSEAITAASDILDSRGNSPRYHKNMLVFLAPDASEWSNLQKTLRDYLAWQTISDEREERNLDEFQRKTARETARKHDSTAYDQLHACWQWLIVPQQDSPDTPPWLDADRHQGKEAPILRAWHRLAGSDKLINELNAQYLLDLLPAAMWRDVDRLDLKRLWDALAQYRYLPRLAGRHVLDACIYAALARMDSPFAHSTGFDADKNRYNGLELTGRPQLYFDGHDCLVKRDVALAQIEREKPPELDPDIIEGKVGVTDTGTGAVTDPVDDTTPPKPAPRTRYFGNVEIDATRALHEIDVIDENVLIWLKSQPKATVKLTLLIEADAPDGFDESAQRTVNENSRTMRFGESAFEE